MLYLLPQLLCNFYIFVMRKSFKTQSTFSWIGVALMVSSCSILPRSWTRKTHVDSKDLRSENPVHQVKAIRTIVENHENSQIPDLLNIMVEGEPTVREYAYWGITQLSGPNPISRTGPQYHSYDSLEERQSAVEDLRKYLDIQGQPQP
jgi:hypothetical protein